MSLYVPTAQFVTAEAPSAHHDPGGHVKHAVSANDLITGLYVPAGQGISKPAGQYLPTPQSKHAAVEEPVPLYVPREQGMCAGDACAQYDPAGQVTHVAELVAAVAEEYVPAAHDRQLVDLIEP